MKRYLAFFGYDYYPSGGMRDFFGDYDTLVEAIVALELRGEEDQWMLQWAHVYDTEERKRVWDKRD